MCAQEGWESCPAVRIYLWQGGCSSFFPATVLEQCCNACDTLSFTVLIYMCIHMETYKYLHESSVRKTQGAGYSDCLLRGPCRGVNHRLTMPSSFLDTGNYTSQLSLGLGWNHVTTSTCLSRPGPSSKGPFSLLSSHRAGSGQV